MVKEKNNEYVKFQIVPYIVHKLVQVSVLIWLHLGLPRGQPEAWTLVRGAEPLARANSMITIREKEMHSLAWAVSTTMRENSTPIG